MNQLTNTTTATIASVPTVVLALNVEELKSWIGLAIMIVAFFYWMFAMLTKAREFAKPRTLEPKTPIAPPTKDEDRQSENKNRKCK